MANKTNHKRGAQCHNAILSEDDVRLMRALRREGLSHQEIGDKFEVSDKQAWEITSYRNWKHVLDLPGVEE